MKRVIPVALGCWTALLLQAGPTNEPDVGPRVRLVVEASERLREVPFAEVILATSGRRIVPLDPQVEADRVFLNKLGRALDEVTLEMNASASPAQGEARINEVSAHFETALRAALNRVPGFACDVPRTVAGKLQRAGYPDLRLVDSLTGRICYLDPKLYEQSSEDSSFRTFYFEPKTGTGKVLEDANHLIAGFAHDGGKAGRWRFLGWKLADMARVNVRLKAEFQASNRDLYLPAAVVGRSGEGRLNVTPGVAGSGAEK